MKQTKTNPPRRLLAFVTNCQILTKGQNDVRDFLGDKITYTSISLNYKFLKVDHKMMMFNPMNDDNE